jgi:hypothetical protein
MAAKQDCMKTIMEAMSPTHEEMKIHTTKTNANLKALIQMLISKP